MSLTEKIINEFNSLEKDLNGEKQSFLFGLRKDAMSSFEKLGIPGNRHEEWRYTNIKTKLPETLSVIPGNTGTEGKLEYNSFAKIVGTKLVFINGVYQKHLSTIIEEKGVTVGSLNEQFKHNKLLTEKYYGTIAKKYEEHFTVLNTAFVIDGAFVHVAKGVEAKNPVFILNLYNSPETFIQTRDLIIGEESSNLNVIVNFQNIGSASFYNHVSEVYVNENAGINITKLQTETANATAVHTLESEVNRNARFTCTTVSFEGKLIRNNTNARLVGENCEVHLNGLYCANNNTLIDNHILVDHIVPNCQSNQLYKGVLDGEASGVFNGKIFVKQDAQKTNAFQSSKAVLLSDEASMNSKPQLEIFADDVKCSHGAAIGQLSESEMFYLRARGIHKEDAKAILTYAFANDIINTVAYDELRQYLDEKLKSRLNLRF